MAYVPFFPAMATSVEIFSDASGHLVVARGTRISTWLVPATMASLLACFLYHSKELVPIVLASAL